MKVNSYELYNLVKVNSYEVSGTNVYVCVLHAAHFCVVLPIT